MSARRSPRRFDCWLNSMDRKPMRIGIVGGTGKEGSGLAMRWARVGHEVRVGSRDPSRGASRAAELAASCGASVSGGSNDWPIDGVEVVELTTG